jgi:hypothetical protein
MNSRTPSGDSSIEAVKSDPDGTTAAKQGVVAAEHYLTNEETIPPCAQAIIAASELITWWRERSMDKPYPFRRRFVGVIVASIASLSLVMRSDLPDRALDYLDNLGVSSVYDKHTGLCEESGGLFGEDRFVAPGIDGNCP